MKVIAGLFAVLVLILVAAKLGQTYLTKGGNLFAKNPTAVVKNQTFNLLIAKSSQEKEIGLSSKSSLPSDTGMLFLFDSPDYYSFWMKNMKFPIDIIYISNDKVSTVISNAQPPKNSDESLTIYKPDQPSDKALEINAGLADKYNIKKGDTITLKNLPK